jgi:hypothetical protein
MPIPAETRRQINEAEVRRYFSAWDPSWRWILVLSLRETRSNLTRLGRLAADEMGNESWIEEDYVYGPLALGITAAAVNEATQHCEDLFALLSFLRDPLTFARNIGSYGPGRVLRLKDEMKGESDAELARRFCVPSVDAIEDEIGKGEGPRAAVDAVRGGIGRLGNLVREVIDFYETYEFFHLQYKHGLKILFRPFGVGPSPEAIAERKTDVRAPIFAITNEVVSKMVQRPPRQQGLVFYAIPEARPHLAEFMANRDLLRVQMAGPPVDLDHVVAHCWTVSRLLRIASANRLALGAFDEHGQQSFELPGEGEREVVSVCIEPPRALELRDVS